MTQVEPADETYSEVVRFRVTPSTKRALAAHVHALGLDEADFMRVVLAAILTNTTIAPVEIQRGQPQPPEPGQGGAE